MSKTSIMYTDVVGYSKLTGDNQEIALKILEEHNQILNKNTKSFSGKIVKLTGDGLCALFEDPLDAINCAINIQKDLKKRNQINIEERKIQIRIGLHYGSYLEKDNDVFGDGVNLAKSIEPIAPHGGIAISSVLNEMINNEKDIYIREYILMDFDSKKIQTYQVYLSLTDWFHNSDKKNTQIVDSKIFYDEAHNLFHNGDYSAAIKFATLALNNERLESKNEILSFICHNFISLGEFDYAEKLILEIDNFYKSKKSNANEEDYAHLLKMKAGIKFNLKKYDSAIELFDHSLKLMIKSNPEYVNEVIYHLCLALNIKNENNLIKKYVDLKNNYNIDYEILVNGIDLLINENIKSIEIDNFIKEAEIIKKSYLKMLSYRLISMIYFNNSDYDNSQKYISNCQHLLGSSKDSISDKEQKNKFIENILIHRHIMEFSDKISDYHLKKTMEEIKKTNSPIENSIESQEFYKFCTNCGTENTNNFKFCVNCGNNLEIN